MTAAPQEMSPSTEAQTRARWIKSQPSHRAAVRDLLHAGEELHHAQPGIERQFAEARWDRARAELQRVESLLSACWAAQRAF
jgi:hypothetical protein